jgi:hypothetical protein
VTDVDTTRPFVRVRDAVVSGLPVYVGSGRDVQTCWMLGLPALEPGDREWPHGLRGASEVILLGTNFAEDAPRMVRWYRELRAALVGTATVRLLRPVPPVPDFRELVERVGGREALRCLVDVPDPEGVGGRHPSLNWHDLLANGAVEPEWLVDDVLERGRSHVLYAPTKTGKSLFALDAAGALAAGHDPLGVPNGLDRPVRVLYLDLENSPADLRERMRAMGHEPDELADLVYLPFPALPPLDTPQGGEELGALVRHHRPELVVFDTIGRFLVGRENDADTMNALYRHSILPLRAAGMTLLRLDQAGRDAGLRGSTAKAEDVDVVWRLERERDERMRLACTHQRSGHHPDVVHLTRGGEPLRHLRVDPDDLVGSEVAELVDRLDRLGVPSDAGRERARTALIDAGVKVSTGTLAEAVRVRKSREP